MGFVLKNPNCCNHCVIIIARPLLTYVTAHILFCLTLIAGEVAENISEDMKTYLNLKGKGNHNGFVVVLCKIMFMPVNYIWQ